MIQLTVQVADINSVMLVYNRIRIYKSDEREGTYIAIGTIVLIAGTPNYSYSDADGTPDNWYKSTYYNSSSSIESEFSNAVRGTSTLYHVVTYSPEFTFDTSEQTLLRKIRRYIGDFKGLERLYVEQETGEACSSILEDNKTIDLAEKGWPVYISIDNVQYTTAQDPIVQGYQYLTFSGTLISGTETKTIEIWYNTFKFSDREIYEAYADAMIPPGLTADTVTQDHLILQASIDLLENMTSEDMVDDGAVIRDDQTLYDPSPGLKERDKTIKRLKKMLDLAVEQYRFYGLEGVLID